MFFVRLVEPVQLYHTTAPGTAAATLVCACVYMHVYMYTRIMCVYVCMYMYEYTCAHTYVAQVHVLTLEELCSRHGFGR